MTPAQVERQKMVKSMYKLDLRYQALKVCYAVVALKVLVGDLVGGDDQSSSNFSKKGQLIYGRLLDIIFKLDHIDAEDTGKQYLNMQDLVTDKRLQEKYEVIEIAWQAGADPDIVQSKDWNSIMDAVQKDINALFNDYKFKRLIKHIDQMYESQNMSTLINIDQIFFIDKFKHDQSPWMEISNKVQADIENCQVLKDKIENMAAKNNQYMKKVIQFEREVGLLQTTKTSLEQRLAATETQIELLKGVKADNEDLVKKHSGAKQLLENQKNETA